MKRGVKSLTLADRIQRVRAWLAPLVADVASSSSYIMELDAITHDVSRSSATRTAPAECFDDEELRYLRGAVMSEIGRSTYGLDWLEADALRNCNPELSRYVERARSRARSLILLLDKLVQP